MNSAIVAVCGVALAMIAAAALVCLAHYLWCAVSATMRATRSHFEDN